YEEIDGGYVAFGGNPKGGKITGKCAIKTRNIDFENGNLVDHKVKVIRCDNGTEFKNREMNQFCKMKGILRQLSVARTPQQNGVAKRRSRTLIEAAKTMLADSKLLTTFWTEVVNTACYVQNRVLVVNHHNKTPYELFHGVTPTLSFIRPFGCPITILNTMDHLGKFDGKTDKGTQRNGFAGTKASDNTDPKSSHDDGFKPSSDNGKKVDEDPRNKNECKDQEKEDNVNSTKNVNTLSLTVNTSGTNKDNELLFDPNMHALEDFIIFNFLNDDEDDGPVANMNNLDTTIQVSPIPTIRIHKDHPLDQVMRDVQSAIQTRKMLKNLEEHGFVRYTQEEGIDYDEVFAPVVRIEAIRLFLAYASFKDFVVYQMDVKSAFLYGKIKEEVCVCQPPGFEDPNFLNKVYKVEKALYRLHQAPRAWPNAESNTKTVNTDGPVNTATPTYADYPGDPLMPDLEDIKIFDDAYDDRDEGAEADYTNLEIVISVSPIPSTRIHKDHPKEQIIREVNSKLHIRKMAK
nr:ribonuclease H-like domain-containing protein [Tanacetum cinerariifolium]